MIKELRNYFQPSQLVIFIYSYTLDIQHERTSLTHNRKKFDNNCNILLGFNDFQVRFSCFDLSKKLYCININLEFIHTVFSSDQELRKYLALSVRVSVRHMNEFFTQSSFNLRAVLEQSQSSPRAIFVLLYGKSDFGLCKVWVSTAYILHIRVIRKIFNIKQNI